MTVKKSGFSWPEMNFSHVTIYLKIKTLHLLNTQRKDKISYSLIFQIKEQIEEKKVLLKEFEQLHHTLEEDKKFKTDKLSNLQRQYSVGGKTLADQLMGD